MPKKTTKNSLDVYDKLEKKTAQAIALLKLISINEDIGNIDIRIVSQSLWAVADMLVEEQALQQLLFIENND